MGFFDDLSKKASETYRNTAEKTNKLTREMKLKSLINDDKGKIEKLYAEIGKKVKLLREAASFTQQQLADYLSVDQSLISKFEKGERSINSDALKQLSVLFCCPISALVSDDEVKPVYNVAFRTNAISQEDLMALSVINRIALNQLQMDQLAGGLKHD